MEYANLLQQEEARNIYYYFQDELGSPIRLMDKNGELAESYGYDEFGQDLYGNQGTVQPFGYMGYQTDQITGTYYAQMREYRAEQGRFAAVDTIKGFAAAPYILNEYGYCWNNPMVLVDLDGKEPTQETEPDTYTYDRDAAIEYAEKWSNSMQGIDTGLEALLGKLGLGEIASIIVIVLIVPILFHNAYMLGEYNKMIPGIQEKVSMNG